MDRDQQFVELEARIEAIGESVDHLSRQVLTLDHAIRGNGQPGLNTRIAIHERRLDELTVFVQEVQGLRRWMSVGVLSLVGSMAWEAITYYMRTAT